MSNEPYQAVAEVADLLATLFRDWTVEDVLASLANKPTETNIRRNVSRMFVGLVAGASMLVGIRSAGVSASVSEDDVDSIAAGCMLRALVSSTHIGDADGRRFWDERIHSRCVAVSLPELFEYLDQHLGRTLDATTRENLALVLDDAGTNLVTAFRFGDFLRGFGPSLELALSRVRDAVEVCLSQRLEPRWFLRPEA